MKLDELLLEKLAEWRFHTDRQSLNVLSPETGWALEVAADCADAIGCRVWQIYLKPTSRREFDLRTRAEHLCAQVTGLLEPLKLVEVDVVRQTAQLRSAEPASAGDDLLYYELLLDGNGAANVRRFQASTANGTKRKQIAFTLTHEALAKLVRDLAA